ncbi:MAG: hypothetical protein SVR08_15210 [Spirochaetota bacterium]|nr:hypothetical protein [Spirochaetota bacterium]
MEVGLVNGFSFPHPNLEKNITQETLFNEVEVPVKTEKIKIDYDEVMMGPDELRNFLFMLIGAEIPKSSNEAGKGANINLLA